MRAAAAQVAPRERGWRRKRAKTSLTLSIRCVQYLLVAAICVNDAYRIDVYYRRFSSLLMGETENCLNFFFCFRECPYVRRKVLRCVIICESQKQNKKINKQLAFETFEVFFALNLWQNDHILTQF